MINRCQFTPDGSNPPIPVPLDDICTVPTEAMAYFLAELAVGDGKGKDVLEIGTGSGYQSAVLAERCRTVVSMDVALRPGVADRLPSNVALMVGNGYEYDTEEQFDAVLVTFAAAYIATSWVKQVKDGGLLVVPVECGNGTRISVYKKEGTELRLNNVAAWAPFTPGVQA